MLVKKIKETKKLIIKADQIKNKANKDFNLMTYDFQPTS